MQPQPYRDCFATPALADGAREERLAMTYMSIEVISERTRTCT
jgi:hypothetical protein